jgi:hypothetical protein
MRIALIFLAILLIIFGLLLFVVGLALADGPAPQCTPTATVAPVHYLYVPVYPSVGYKVLPWTHGRE